MKAIEAKETKYYPSTDTLLVDEVSANFRYLKEGGLYQKVCEATRRGLGAPFKRIYVNYGNGLKLVK